MLATAGAGAMAPPPPPRHEPKILQFGVALAGKFAFGSPFCRSEPTCILGSGAGIGARVGRAFSERWYLGGGYEFSKHNSSLLYRLPILQQARVEGRYRYPVAKNWFVGPFAWAGLVGYGNEWSIRTWGPSLGLGAAGEAHVGGSVVGLGLSWQGMYLQRLEEPGRAGAYFSAGVPQFLTLELRLEATELF
jgi:hypothetical protein